MATKKGPNPRGLNARMLYRFPGETHLPQHGGSFEIASFMKGEINARLSDGWHLTAEAAKAAHEHEDDEEPQRTADLPAESPLAANDEIAAPEPQAKPAKKGSGK